MIKITDLTPAANVQAGDEFEIARTGTPNLSLSVTAQNIADFTASVNTRINFAGTWNATTNIPPLASGVGTPGAVYVVSVSGMTMLDGINDWNENDWAVFDDVANVWRRVVGEIAAQSVQPDGVVFGDAGGTIDTQVSTFSYNPLTQTYIQAENATVSGNNITRLGGAEGSVTHDDCTVIFATANGSTPVGPFTTTSAGSQLRLYATGDASFISEGNLTSGVAGNSASPLACTLQADNAGAGTGTLNLNASDDIIGLATAGNVSFTATAGTATLQAGTSFTVEGTTTSNLVVSGTDVGAIVLDISAENLGAGDGDISMTADNNFNISSDQYNIGGLDMNASSGLNKIDGYFEVSGANPYTIGSPGARSVAFFYPTTGVFRAGRVTGVEWDSANLGLESSAFGLDTTASGAQSFAAGDGNTAASIRSACVGGENNSVQAPAIDGATVGGNGNTITAGIYGAIVGGMSHTLSGNGSVVLGGSTNSVSGVDSVALGGAGSSVTGPSNNAYVFGVAGNAAANGTYVFADSAGGAFSCSTQDAVAFQATGGFGIGTGAPNSGFDSRGTFSTGRTPVLATITTAEAPTRILGVTQTSPQVFITLQTADAVAGREYIIKDESGTAGTTPIIINTQGAETIDGQATLSIIVDYGSVRLYSDGSNWFTY